MKPPPTHWPQVYLCVALTTLATLLLELSLTRIFSVVFYYHLAFLAISIALFGLGVGGVFSYVVAGWKAPLYVRLGRLSVANTFCVLLSLFVILIQGNNLSNLQPGPDLLHDRPALFHLRHDCLARPSRRPSSASTASISSISLGAAGGCLVLLPLLDLLGGPSTVVVVRRSSSPSPRAVWFSMAGSVKGRVGSVTLALMLVAFLTYNFRHPVIEPTHAKNQTLANETFIKWNSFSRIAIVHNDKEKRDNIVIDADAATSIFNYDLEPPRRRPAPRRRDRGRVAALRASAPAPRR